METFLTVRSWIRFLTFPKQAEFTEDGIERPIVRPCVLVEGWFKDHPLADERTSKWMQVAVRSRLVPSLCCAGCGPESEADDETLPDTAARQTFPALLWDARIADRSWARFEFQPSGNIMHEPGVAGTVARLPFPHCGPCRDWRETVSHRNSCPGDRDDKPQDRQSQKADRLDVFFALPTSQSRDGRL